MNADEVKGYLQGRYDQIVSVNRQPEEEDDENFVFTIGVGPVYVEMTLKVIVSPSGEILEEEEA